ncbi:MAG: NDP-sugar synthase [Candidatus Obscuribacterales bacterium]|nr:NDP-sugar synthase [Candidatus Obscuribacterales bacterium]
MKAMVLAAGVGSRLDPLTTQLPKPLVPVGNVPVMEHIINLLSEHGIKEIIANLHYLPEKLIEYFGDGSNFGTKITWHQEKELSGDAGGVRACKSFLQDGTFLVLMGDLLTDTNLSDVIKAHKASKALATIAIKRVDDVSQFGVVLTNKDSFITGFQEKPDPSEALSDLASTGIYVLEPEVFNYIPKDGTFGFGKQLFPLLVEKGLPVFGYEIGNYWSDVGTIKQYRISNFDALEDKVKLKLPGNHNDFGYIGQNTFIADNARITGNLMLGNNSRIESGVKISGNVIIGDNCIIGANADLRDTVVWSDSNIEPGVSLVHCVIGHNCVVKNGSRHLEAATVS